MGGRARNLLSLLLALGALSAGPARAADDAQGGAEVSVAERLMFLQDDLGDLHPPTALRYSFDATLVGSPKKDEQVQLVLQARSDGGCCAVALEEGAAFGAMPPVGDAKANPIILYFLEHDLREMQGLTGGQSSYFRHLIRLSLAEHASVKDVTVRYAGRDVEAKEVSVVPYETDARMAQLGPLAKKSYAFILAKAVPGGVFQIRTSGPGGGAPPIPEAVLTLVDPAAPGAVGGPVQK